MHAESNGSASVRTIADLVAAQGILLGRYRAGRLIKTLELASCQIQKHSYKKADQEHVAIINKVSEPNRVWRGDVIYTWISKPWAYLAAVLDLFVLRPIGEALPLPPDSELIERALATTY